MTIRGLAEDSIAEIYKEINTTDTAEWRETEQHRRDGIRVQRRAEIRSKAKEKMCVLI